MKSLYLVASIAILLIVLNAGCGSTPSTNSQSSPPTSARVAPLFVTVQASAVQQFIATITPSVANQAVTWSISGAGCSGSACGTIDATGKYTAPASVPSPATVTLTASSVADGSKAATATITVVSAGNFSVSLNPTFLAFGNQAINTTSAPQTVTVTNTGSAAQALSGRIGGINFGDFAGKNDCPSVVAVGVSCTFTVTFTPSGKGQRFGILSIDGTLDEEGLIPLTGNSP